MPKLPRITARRIIAVITKLGFFFSRQVGSHKIYINSGGLRITVSVHDNKIIKPKTLKAILKDADLTVKDLKELL